MFKAKNLIFCLLIAALMAACSPAAAQTTPTETLSLTQEVVDTPFVPATNTPAPTATVTPKPTLDYPVEGYGPADFPENVDPLTGLKVADAQLLDRRPIVIKVQNLPREDRPQYGLSKADIVYEYYTEYGSTRFAAIFYGQDASQVMPIRSARYSDSNFIRMYKSIFVFGSAYAPIYARLANSEFSDRLILETGTSCPAVCRFDPSGHNFLVADTAALQDLLKTRGVDNTRQNLDGMSFNQTAPTGGDPAAQVFVRFSGAIYNRWDYDAITGKYLRFAETKNDIGANDPAYAQLTDALTKQPITADNLVIIQVRHNEVDPNPKVEVVDMSILGSGPAYLARDGKLFKVQWERKSEADVLHLVDDAGQPVAFKPGQTWFEVFSVNSTAVQDGNNWNFQFVPDW